MDGKRRLFPVESRLRVGVVGYGYWGPNLVRNVIERPELDFAACASATARARRPSRPASPASRCLQELDEMLADPDARRGPRRHAAAHAPPDRARGARGGQARAGREAARHERSSTPATSSPSPRQRDLVLMPGHTFIYSPPVNKVQAADRRGRDRRHLLRHLIAHEPRQVPGRRRDLRPRAARPLDPAPLARRAGRARSPPPARSVFQEGVPETAFLTLTFESGTAANIQLSWLAPRKVRDMIVVGSRRMVQYDDLAADEAVRIYDRGMEFTTARELRRASAHLSQRRHRHAAARGVGAARRSSCRTSHARSARAPSRSRTPSSASRSCW